MNQDARNVDYASIPEGVPLILTLKFSSVDPYEVLAVYKGQKRHWRGKGAHMWEHLPSRYELHDTAVGGITGWRTATAEEVVALTSNQRGRK